MHQITGSTLARYGALAAPVAFAGFPLYVLGPDYYATTHGISLTLLAGLLLLIRGFDAVQDPLFGWLIDHKRHAIRQIAFAAGAVLCAAIAALFNGVVFTPAIWFTLCMFIAVSAYSLLTICLGVVGTLWTADAQQQTRIAAVRESFALGGLVTAVSLPVLIAMVAAESSVYMWYAGILAVLMLGGLLAFSATARAVLSQATAGTTRAGPTAAVSLRAAVVSLSGDTRRLLVVYLFSMCAASVPAVLLIFFVRDRLDAENLLGVFMLLYFASGAAAMPLWRRVSAHKGKAQAWAMASMLAIVGFFGALFLQTGDIYAYALICVASGVSLGADLILPPSMLADNIHAGSNQNAAATQYAFLPFIAKASLALATVLVLPALDMADFVPKAENTAAGLRALSLLYAGVPCAIKLLAVVLMYRFFIQRRSDAQ